MTRVFFDATSLDAEPSGARSRLLLLVPELAERGHEIAIACPGRLEVAGARWIRAPRRGPVLRALRRSALARAAVEARSDVVVFETLPAPRLPVPAVMLVHDLRHARASGLRRRVAIAWLRDAARRVVRFHVPSEATRTELVALLPAARDKVDVVPNAVVVPDDPAATPLPPGIAPGFVFAAGHAEPRKDWAFVAGLAAALAPAGVRVVRAGRGSTPDPRVVDLGVVPDAVRDALFHAALAVVAPSRLEGFGLVPLEALACGAHVVASDVPAHREVLGGAADFFPPGDVTAALALVRAAGRAPASARAARAAAARARAASFSPSGSADAFEASLRAIGL